MVARFILVLFVFLFVGMLTVWQRAQTTRAGYDVSRLELVKESLLRRNKSLQIESDRLKSPDALLTSLENLKQKLHIAGPDELVEIESSHNQPKSEVSTAKQRGESCRFQE